MGHFEELGQYTEVERLESMARERGRIQGILQAYFDRTLSEKLSEIIFDAALELDHIVEKILQHPGVKERYRYDGALFSERNPELRREYALSDGLTLLRNLQDNNLNYLVSARNPEKFLREWMDERHLIPARNRLAKLKASDGLEFTSYETIEEAARRASSPPEPTDYDFLKKWEEQFHDTE